MIEDFTARRQAAIEAKRLLIEEMNAENERDYQIHCAEREFEDWLEREHTESTRRPWRRNEHEPRPLGEPARLSH